MERKKLNCMSCTRLAFDLRTHAASKRMEKDKMATKKGQQWPYSGQTKWTLNSM